MTHDVSRRSVGKAAMWSVPAITVAAAAPAVAASTPVSPIYMEGYLQGITTPDNGRTGTDNTHPTFEEGSYAFYQQGQNVTVTSLVLQILVTAPSATWDFLPNTSQGQSNWSLPTAPSGTDTLDGKTVYIYNFTYIGPTLSGDELVQESSEIDYHIASGGEAISVGDPFQGRIVATVNGTSQTRVGPVLQIPDNGYTAQGEDSRIGDAI